MLRRTSGQPRPRLLPVAAAVSGAILLAGCQADPEETQPPSVIETKQAQPGPSSSPDAVPSPSESASKPEPTPASSNGPAANIPVPEKPALADENTRQGLEAFTRYWFELFDYGYATNDWSAFDKVTDPGCATCNNIKLVVQEIYEDGMWLRGGEFEVMGFDTRFELNAAGSIQSFVKNRQSPITYYGADGTELRTDPPPDAAIDVTFALHTSEGWVMLDYGKPEGT